MDADHRREGKSSMDKGDRLMVGMMKFVEVFGAFAFLFGGVNMTDSFKAIPIATGIVGFAMIVYGLSVESWLERRSR